MTEIAAAIIAGIATILAAVITVWSQIRRKRESEPKIVEDDERTKFAAAICYRRNGPALEFLLVRTTGGRWTFPKGKVRDDETGQQAAEREAFEEAGAAGVVEAKRLAVYRHQKREFKREGTEQRIAAYLLRVESTTEPLEKKRDPTWCSREKAIDLLVEDREHAYAQEFRRVLDLASEALR